MYDVAPSGTYPAIAPYESQAANAIVMEGLYPCEGSTFSISNIEQWTVYWVNAGYQTVTEITPYGNCAGYTSISAYESELQQIEQYVEQNASNPGQYWGGFMLDEEPNYYFSASNLESLNSYTSSLMSQTPGLSWYFSEAQPNGWVLSTYNSIISGSWPAPQAYTSGTNSMIAAINDECSVHSSECTNLVTINATFSYPYNDYAWVTGQVNGSAWQNGYWGTSTWCNYYNNV